MYNHESKFAVLVSNSSKDYVDFALNKKAPGLSSNATGYRATAPLSI
jgi:hypothetical protein